MTDDDTELVRRAQAGDSPAFEELVRRTGRLVYARLVLETNDRDRADDLTQETFLLAYKSVRRLKNPAGFRSWLLTIAHNVATDAARHALRQKRDAGPPSDTPPDAVPATGASPDEQLHQSERRERVLAALRSLPEEHRLPLTLRYLAGADYDTISTQLGLTNGSLRGLLHRGLKLLRDRLPADLRPDE